MRRSVVFAVFGCSAPQALSALWKAVVPVDCHRRAVAPARLRLVEAALS